MGGLSEGWEHWMSSMGRKQGTQLQIAGSCSGRGILYARKLLYTGVGTNAHKYVMSFCKEEMDADL